MHGQPQQPPPSASSPSSPSSPSGPAPGDPYGCRSTACPWLLTALGLGLAAGVVIALVQLGWSPLHSADTGAAGGLHRFGLAHRTWTHANLALSERVWSPWTMRALLALAVVWLWLRRQWLLGVWCAAACAVESGVQQTLKAAIDRPRPHWQHPFHTARYAAMPSGHAMTAALVSVLLLWLLWRTRPGPGLWGAALTVGFVSVAGVSFTRVAIGVHWVSDTVAGVLLGCALGALTGGLWLMRAAEPRRPAPARTRQQPEGKDSV